MEQMNGKLSVRYEYRDARKIKQAQEISISSEYADSFNLYQIANFMLSVIEFTGHTTRDVLLAAIESSDYANDITDELIYLGYGTQAEVIDNQEGEEK